MANGLLYNTKYVTPQQTYLDSDKVKQRDRDSFRKFWEQSEGLPGLTRGKTKLSGMMESGNQPDVYDVRNQSVILRDDQKSRPAAYQRSKIICIDSKDRDLTVYPDPAMFRVYFGEQFTNVCRIQLLDTQLPNTEQLIRSQPPNKRNDTISWMNGPDEEDHGQIYSITITPGNYTPDTFANEIVSKSSAVARNLPSQTEKVYHSFDVVVNGITNTFVMRQNRSSTLANPLSTTAGSPIVSVNHTSHGFFTGQVINLSGCSNVAGLAADVLNTAQVITVNTEKVDSLIPAADSSTEVIYGTTFSTLTGTVNTQKNKNVVIGHGTIFLTELSAGNVINIGYYTYTVDTVVSDYKLITEELLKESFDGFTLIQDLSGSNTGMQLYPADPTLTQVDVINTRLRNLGADITAARLEVALQEATQLANKNPGNAAYKAAVEVASAAANVAAAALSQETTYQNSINDLNLSIYNKIQKIIYIHDLPRSFQLTASFASRDSPTTLNSTTLKRYQTYNAFYLQNNVENFNIVQITSANNTFVVQYPTFNTTITLPIRNVSTIGLTTVLSTVLLGWSIRYDTISKLYYFTPPWSGATVNIVANARTYICSTQVPSSFNFQVSNTASFTLGFSSSTTVSGTAVISTSTVVGGTQISLGSTGQLLHVLDTNYVFVAEVNVGLQTFTNINQLLTLLNSIFIVRNVPLVASYMSGMQAVVITSALPGYVFQIAFPQQTVGGLATALGLDPTRVYKNLTLRSQSAINNIISQGYYSHKFLEYINAVGLYKSRQIRGVSSITNTSNIVLGNPDTFQGNIVQGTFTDTSGKVFPIPLSVNLTGQTSNNVWQLISSPIGVNVETDLSYFQNPTITSAQALQKYRVTGRHVDIYKVIYASSRFSFVRASDGKMFNDSALEYELGRTMCFDLRSLNPSSIFKLSNTQNGNWGYHNAVNTAELLQYTRYMCNGQFLQLCIPESASLASPYLYLFNEKNEETIATANMVVSNLAHASITTFYCSLIDSQLCISSSVNGTADETPILHLKVGQIYVFDFSAITADTLLLSTSIDGSHFNNGRPMTSSSNQFFSSGSPTSSSTSSTAFTLNLSTDKGPFPNRVFYYLQTLAGAGGDGYLDIRFPDHSGTIAVVQPGKKEYNLYNTGSIVDLALTTNTVGAGSALIYSPFGDSPTISSSVNLLNTSSDSIATTTVSNSAFNVTLDNNRFIVIDTLSKQEITVSIGIGIRQMGDITSEMADQINRAFSITSLQSEWEVIFDNESGTYTFVVQNGRQYSFQFFGTDANGVDIFNSAAELLGFSRSETPMNITNGSTNIVSSTSANFSATAEHVFSVTSLPEFGDDTFTSWSESLVDTKTGNVYPIVNRSFYSHYSGSRFTQDLAINDVILLGTDYDTTFTVVAILNDYELKMNSNVAIIGASVDNATGLPIAAPTTTYEVKIYKFNNVDPKKFSTNDEMFFNRSLTSRSVYDYDDRLVGSEFLVTRISPVKLSIQETDMLLISSATDTSMTYNYTSINNHDLKYVTNNSKYNFVLGIPATSTVANKGGNPISVGTGVKYQLLFSQTNTPGNILGFMNVGIPVQGDTGYRTVQSNTLPDTSTSVAVVRSVPGNGNFSGNLQIVTNVPHTFQFGDVIYITNHSGSSNDLAINSDEGYTINLDPSGSTFTESIDNITYTRGYFYIPLNAISGGSGGEAFRRKLFRPFALAGDNYVYLTCPLLNSLSTTSSKVQNIFAKIALNSPPGSIIFNSFTSTEKIFNETPVAFLDHLDFTMVDGEGQLFLFNNTDWSCSIKITVASTTLPSTGISSRTDLYNELASGNSTSNLQTHS